MKKIPILCLALFSLLLSCNEQKKIGKFVKKHGPKEVTTFIALNYPEYLTKDSAKIDTTLIKIVNEKSPEIKKDTAITMINDPSLKGDKSLDCIKHFKYSDKNIILKIDIINDIANFNYDILAKYKKDTIRFPIHIKAACPPCPTEAIVQNAEKEMIDHDKPNFWHTLFKSYFWVSWGLIILYILFKTFKVYLKTVFPFIK